MNRPPFLKATAKVEKLFHFANKTEKNLGSADSSPQCHLFVKPFNRGLESKQFSGFSVNFDLKRFDSIIIQIIKALFFRDILSYKPVRIFIQASFPRGIGMSEEETRL
jgi:hypothetical protein